MLQEQPDPVSYTHLDVYKRQALPVAQALKAQGTKVTGIIGFRNQDLVILEDEFRACCDELIIMSDDGSYGQKGVVTMPLEEKTNCCRPPANTAKPTSRSTA